MKDCDIRTLFFMKFCTTAHGHCCLGFEPRIHGAVIRDYTNVRHGDLSNPVADTCLI